MAKPKTKQPAAKATSKKKPAAKSSAKKTKPKAKAKPAPKAKAKATPKAKAKAAPKKTKPKAKAKATKAKVRVAPKPKPKAAKARPAAKAPKATKPATGRAPSEQLRGVALVDAVMEQRIERGDKLVPMAADAIDAIGFEPSPALRRWLEHDGEMFTLGQPQSLAEMLDAEVGEWAEAFVDLGRYLTGQVVVFEGWGADSRRFLYLGARDELGEYPVFTLDTDDTPFACINGPVDVWLAQHAGFLADEEYYGLVPPEYEPVRRAHAALAFGGFVAHVDGAFSKSLDPYAEDADDDAEVAPQPVPQVEDALPVVEVVENDDDDDDIVDRLAGITEEKDDEVAPPPGPADEEDDDLEPARNELADDADDDEVDDVAVRSDDEVVGEDEEVDEDDDDDEDEDEDEEDDIVEVDAALLANRPIEPDDEDEDKDDDGLHEVDDEVDSASGGDLDDRGDEDEEVPSTDDDVDDVDDDDDAEADADDDDDKV